MNSYKKALYIYNGNAGKKNVLDILNQTVGVISACCKELTIVATKEKGDAERICSEKGSSFDLVIILGGDGTVHECINGLSPLLKRPKVAVLPGGTCNDFSRSLNIPQNLEQAAELIFEGSVQNVDVVKEGENYFVNFWGTGLITDASENINDAIKGVLGRISYFISAIQTIQNAEPFNVKLTIDEEIIEEQAVMVLVANGRFIGTNELPLPSLELDDGLVDLFVVKEAGFQLFKELLTVKGSGVVDEKNQDIQHYQGKSLKIETEEVQKVDMDGEVYSNTPSELRVLKHHLQFIGIKKTP
jgi:diacylglycerol kinase (ATP)